MDEVESKQRRGRIFRCRSQLTESKNPDPIILGLVLRRDMHTVNGRLEVSARENLEGVGDVDSNGLLVGLDPMPGLISRVEDLKGGDRLPEEEGDGTEIGLEDRGDE